jgi:hypothetical protein
VITVPYDLKGCEQNRTISSFLRNPPIEMYAGKVLLKKNFSLNEEAYIVVFER